jgi:hypothetical protein
MEADLLVVAVGRACPEVSRLDLAPDRDAEPVLEELSEGGRAACGHRPAGLDAGGEFAPLLECGLLVVAVGHLAATVRQRHGGAPHAVA